MEIDIEETIKTIWHEYAKDAISNGICPWCFSGDEEGHKPGCYVGELENKVDQLQKERDRARAELVELNRLIRIDIWTPAYRYVVAIGDENAKRNRG